MRHNKLYEMTMRFDVTNKLALSRVKIQHAAALAIALYPLCPPILCVHWTLFFF